jgi:squalene-associated FAD-dependent desaturase
MTPNVVVIGAGCAGLSAAVRLATANVPVVVVEEAPRLGGRASAFTDRETGERVDNGQHVLFGCYRETYAFLRAIGAQTRAPLETRLSLTMADDRGRLTALRCPRLPPPWHLIGGVLGWSALSIGDRLAALKLRRFLDDVRHDGASAATARVPATETVDEWLRRHGQTEGLSRWLWRPLALAALNQSSSVAAARPFVRVLGELFGPRLENSAIGLPAVPLDELYAEPARAFLESHGGRVITKTPARIQVTADGRAIRGVEAGGEFLPAETVISAVPWHALERIWTAAPPATMAGILADARRRRSSPIVTVNLWLDGPVMTSRFVGLMSGPMQWVFDKSAIFGTHAGHLSLVASGADDVLRLENAALVRMTIDELSRALPVSRARRLLRSVVVRESRATFSLAPGEPPRPPTVTPLAGFYLAGDWVDTGLPGTIESAVASGHRAADEAAMWRMGRRGRGAAS